MTPCPRARAVLEVLPERPQVPVGVHLALTADFPAAAWAPLTAGPSLQEGGYLMGVEHRKRLLTRAVASEVEAEFRAQIGAALAAGIQPTHLDWQCLAAGGRKGIFDLFWALAEEYSTALRTWGGHGHAALRGLGRTEQDQPFLDSFTLPVEGKQERVLAMIRALPPGISEWAFHPAGPHAADAGSEVRASDHDVLMAPATRQALQDETITMIGQDDPRFHLPARTGEEQAPIQG